MEWIILVIIAVIFASVTLFNDNYISDYYFKGNNAASQKFFFLFLQLIFGAILVFCFGIDFSSVSFWNIFVFIISGFIASISSIFYYRALEADDSTNIGIFVQLAPILYLVFGWAFLGETISVLQLVAFFVIIAAPLLIILTTKKRSRKMKLRAMGFAFLYVLIAVVGNLIFVKEDAGDLNFGAELGLVFIGKGIGNAVILAINPKWRRRFRNVVRSSKRKVLRAISVSFVAGAIKEFAYRGALVLAPSVALASAASDSSQPVVVFFMGIILTLISPKFGREKLDKKTVLVHLFATILVITGIILIQV